MKILYLTNIPSPYIVDFLNELGKFCELTVIFERSTSAERDKSWENYRFVNFTGIVLKGVNVRPDSAASPGILKYIKKNAFDHIIVANPCTPTGIIALEYMKLRKIPYIIESEGGFAKSGRGIKEKFKKQIMSGAYLYFSTCEVDDEYFLMYGAKKDKIVRYPFTSLYKDEILTELLTEEEKQSLKQKLNLNEKITILSIGRFIPIKGFDILLQACKNLSEKVGICIIGGAPTDEYMNIINGLHLRNIYFIDHLSKKEIKEYYLAADMFVLPTRSDTWGLVIPEAMSYGMPVISTNQCVAALALIKDLENGFVIPTENVNVLEEKMELLIRDSDLRKKIANNNIVKMRNYSIEEMAQRHLEVFKNYIL